MLKNKFSIALVSDYFYPNKGGVETHIRTVGEELVKMGHSVIVITHKYKNFVGVRKIENLTVYYLDIPIIAMNTTFPTLFANLLLFKAIFTKHKIDIIHGHQSLSNLCMEAIFHGSHLNIKTVLTDHSIFEISKPERILVNNLNSFVCRHVDRGVCVSLLSKQNTHLRTGIPLAKISFIPNGIVPEKFYPVKKNRSSKIKVIFMSRLTFRKGIDLMVDALPLICKNKVFEVMIVGNGPMKSDIEQVIDENDLHDQVKLLGEIDYEDVGNFLRSGNIFVNTSLTETFCLANLEAAACGLVVVSTNVGGVSEVLESDSILFCKPTGEDIAEQVNNAIKRLDHHKYEEIYQRIISKYTWEKVAKLTEDLYFSIPEKKISFFHSISSYPGTTNFLSRLCICIEYLQLKIVSFIENKFTVNCTNRDGLHDGNK